MGRDKLLPNSTLCSELYCMLMCGKQLKFINVSDEICSGINYCA